jgi:hypothetical protein
LTHRCFKASSAGRRSVLAVLIAGAAIKIAIHHTSCTQACRSVVMHRGDVGWDADPDSGQHEQTSKCIRAIGEPAPSNKGAGTPSEYVTAR